MVDSPENVMKSHSDAEPHDAESPDQATLNAHTEKKGGRRRRHKKRKSHRKRHRGGSSCGNPQPYAPDLQAAPVASVGGKRRRRSKKHRRKSTRKGMRRKTARRAYKH